MIPIYICDDNADMLQALDIMIKKHILIQNYDMSIVCCTTTPLEIIDRLKADHQRAVYILDVDLKSNLYDGFSLAKQIREHDTRGFIIFVTTHEELLLETFKYRLEAMNYLIKEDVLLENQLGRCLDDIHHLISQENCHQDSYYTVRIADMAYQIPIHEILYFETAYNSHCVVLYTLHRRLEFRGNLNAIEKEMDSSFLRIHRSFLIHMGYITVINNADNTLLLNHCITCPISRKGKRLLKEKGIS